MRIVVPALRAIGVAWATIAFRLSCSPRPRAIRSPHLGNSLLPLSRSLVVAAGSDSSAKRAQDKQIDYAALRDETVRAMSEYLQINTTNPPGNELATAKWLKAFLAKEGIESQILDTAELGAGRANLYARLKGDGSQKAIALVHHMDVVPADSSMWSVPPFSGAVKDGYVWGRGALDMKSEGIIHLMSMVALKRAGVHLTRDIVFIANSDEEVEGTGAVVFTHQHPDLLKDVEFMITEGEGTNVENGEVKWFAIGVAEKRAYWLRLVAHGTTAHGSIPRADNPVPRLARAVARAAAWQTPIHLLPAVDRFFKAEATLETGEHRAWLSNAKARARDAARARIHPQRSVPECDFAQHHCADGAHRIDPDEHHSAGRIRAAGHPTDARPGHDGIQARARARDRATRACTSRRCRASCPATAPISTPRSCMRSRRRFTKCSPACP